MNVVVNNMIIDNQFNNNDHYIGYIPLFTASTANSILFLFNIRWTIRMKCYL